MRGQHIAMCVIAAVIGSLPLLAQLDSGQISGFVRDPSQSSVASATVIVTNEGNGEKHHTTTNANGYYVIPNLFVGSYTVEVEAAGFKKAVQSGIKLSAVPLRNLQRGSGRVGSPCRSPRPIRSKGAIFLVM